MMKAEMERGKGYPRKMVLLQGFFGISKKWAPPYDFAAATKDCREFYILNGTGGNM